ncbi:MAG: substrate-binding domain-containing protein [Oscillospiraceae bacterium]|nr:substrate-binding domain-containing protein [Oscillospiraceae bacterium]
MSLRKYNIIAILMALLATPVLMSIGFIVGYVIGRGLIAAIIISSLFLLSVWFLYAKFARFPEKASDIFLPVLIAFCYYIISWIILFGLSNYNLNDDLIGIYIFLAMPYIGVNFFVAFIGNYSLFPVINGGAVLTAAIIAFVTRFSNNKKIIFDKRFIVYAAIAILLCGISGMQFYIKSINTLGGYDYNAERVGDEVDFWNYQPFSRNNFLKSLNETPDITFTEDYPKLDGATAAYPVYGAIAQELYKGLDEITAENYVKCTTTANAYERLIRGEIDILFGAQPSQQQIQSAREKGVEFTLTPIAKEAFVFFVHKDNPVSSLTLEQIQDIYQKKITNWKKVGGKSEKIMPFQRPENSGSQTVMLAMIMKDKKLPAPLREEYAAGMGGIINQVAEYRNYTSAIGYSFRYFATGMRSNDNIKLLAIDGTEPTVENIRNGAYAFTVDVYAVTAGPQSKNTAMLINWILSEQGQNFIETCGYVRRGD